jgi:50S ribosomal subunit-associated GTPase HflX
VALNKIDLADRWALAQRDEEALAGAWDMVRTSAKTGDGVEEVFRRLGRATLTTTQARP